MTVAVLIRSIRRHSSERVGLVALHRGDIDKGVVFRADESVEQLLADDRLEFA